MLLNSMYHIERRDGKVFLVRLCPDHIIYSAHFPGEPISPGVCILQMVMELAEIIAGGTLRLKEIKNLKFLNVISPIDRPTLFVEFQTVSNGCVKGSIHWENKVYTKFSLMCQL